MYGSSGYDGGKALVWSHLGKILKEKDKERLLACTQQNPEYHLAILYNKELYEILADINDKPVDQKVKNRIFYLNQRDNLFRQIAMFFRENPDMLSIGSAVAGEFDKLKGSLKTIYDKEGDIDG